MMSVVPSIEDRRTVRRDADHRRRHPLTLIASPMPRPLPKTRRRKPSLITTTASSDSLKNRPADARAPTMSK
jgi:hypothetical protein